ncbi:MAG: nickel-dependent lactate racemase, partial [Actinomycetota bacterium]
MTIPYGDSEEQVFIPDDRLQGVLAASLPEPCNEKDLLKGAVSAPVGRGPIATFAAAGENVLVLVNDATRPTPTAMMLETVWDEIKDWELGFLIATGIHRNPSEAECRRIFGSLWKEVRGRVTVHEARDKNSLVHIGTTSFGTDVQINRLVAEARKILVLSSVEPHYFAGYTGGRKIFVPGVSGFKTIEQNHCHALNAGARPFATCGNPVRSDIDEAFLFLAGRDIFSLMAVLDREQRVCQAAAGDLDAVFSRCARRVNELYAVEVGEQADIVLAVATPPLDVDFYQAQKVVENGKMALTEGGILIIVSACSDGVGNEAFI